MRVTAAVEDDAERVALQLVERPHPRPVRGERVPGELDARASPVTTPRRCDAHDGDRLMCFFIPRRTHRRADPRQGAALESATPTTLGIRTRNHASPRVRTHRTGPSVYSHHPIEPSPQPCGIGVRPHLAAGRDQGSR